MRLLANPVYRLWLSNVLLALSLSGALIGAVILLGKLPVLPINQVRIRGDLQHVTQADLNQVSVKYLQEGNFISADLVRIQAGFESLPWVRKAVIRRAWPNRLDIYLEEQKPVGRWAAGGLVNDKGERFMVQTTQKLPIFYGAEGTEKEVVAGYKEFEPLIQSVGHSIAAINLSSRRAWTLKLEDGLQMELGRESVKERLSSFIATYTRAMQAIKSLQYVDLRYPNGFVVQARDAMPAPAVALVKNKPKSTVKKPKTTAQSKLPATKPPKPIPSTRPAH